MRQRKLASRRSDGGRISPRIWSAMRQIQNEMSRVFDNVVAGAEDGSNVVTSRLTPAVDIREDSGQFAITAIRVVATRQVRQTSAMES